MKYKHVGFNSKWVAAQSLAEFQKHEAHHGFTKDQLAEIHKLCKLKENPVKSKEGSKPDSSPDAGGES